MLEAKDICYKAGSAVLVQPCTVSFEPGQFTVIMGPNGAGKSTLLQMLSGELVPAAGKVRWEGKELNALSRLEWARMRAVLSQHYNLQFPVSVREVVQLGRYPHTGSVSAAQEALLVGHCLT